MHFPPVLLLKSLLLLHPLCMLQFQGALVHSNLPYWGIGWHWREPQVNGKAEPWTSEFLLHPSKAVLDELTTAGMPEAFWVYVNPQGLQVLQTHRQARNYGMGNRHTGSQGEGGSSLLTTSLACPVSVSRTALRCVPKAVETCKPLDPVCV